MRRRENPPVNVLLGNTAKTMAENPDKVTMLYRDKLAERLGIAPKERLTMTVIQDDQRVFISVLLDGGDLTSAQEKVLRVWLVESGVLTIMGIFPEKPTTS